MENIQQKLEELKLEMKRVRDEAELQTHLCCIVQLGGHYHQCPGHHSLRAGQSLRNAVFQRG